MRAGELSKRIAKKLLAWHAAGHRRLFPWQHTGSAYGVWVSEIMLQQTRAETVIPYYGAFMRAFPDIASLAAAEQGEVLRLWSGLGYYSRARNLHRAAGVLMAQHGGELPRTLQQLTALPGIGRSTAGAILALGFGGRGVILDGNVRRVLTRLYAVQGAPAKAATLRRLWQLADDCTPLDASRAGEYAQAIMNFGAVVCTPRQPDCAVCPLRGHCLAHRQNRQHELPPQRSRVRPLRQARWLLLRWAAGEVMLEKVEGAGVWRGLWVLPQLADGETPQQACGRLTGLPKNQYRLADGVWKEARHGFTHFELVAEIYLAEPARPPARIADSDRQFFGTPTRALQELALPAPVRKLLVEMGQQRVSQGIQ